MNFDKKLKDILKENLEFVESETGELSRNEIVNHALKADKELIELLIKDKEIRETFFDKIKDYWVFNINKFVDYIENIKIVDNSYTKFKNQVGLNINNKFLRERGEVSLVWPFKDCVLEGGMTKEDQERNEIFFNEILAKDEIDRLFDPKVLTNFKKYTAKGEEKVKDFNRNKDGTITDNLVIKGNNLLALHSLKKEFAGKVKLIYIDPPYNIGTNDFGYNDNFNHSTWLTFMKNRLEIAKSLLTNEGVIFVQIDYNEFGYLKVIMDEIFSPENALPHITVKTSTPAGFKVINPGLVNVSEQILVYSNGNKKACIKEAYVKSGYQKDYSNVILNIEDSPDKWSIDNIKDIALKKLGFNSFKDLINKFDKITAVNILLREIEKYALNNSDSVFATYAPHKPSNVLQEGIAKSKKNKDKIIVVSNDRGGNHYLINGRLLAFYKNKLKEVDGETVPTRRMTDFWDDISWDSLSNEGGVSLKNGKKPEALLKRIIEISTEKKDIVLDYHLGSGTTCAVAHKMGRQYIGIEQLDYDENDSVVRLKNVIKGDLSGISEIVNWKSGGEFIHCELMKYNQEAIEKIRDAKDTKQLLKIWDEMCEKYFLNYDVEIKKFNDNKKLFEEMTLKQQKEELTKMLNKNQLYVNLSEIEDSQFKVSKEDKELNKRFYDK